MPYWFEPTTVTLDVGGRPMTIETGRLAKQAAGAVVVTYGDTSVLVTAVHSSPRPGIDFFPLTVDFVEKFAAAGRIPGGFFKREGRLSDREVLVSRFIDRSIRPLFAEGYNDETQVTATVLSSQSENAADMCAFVGASAALSLSPLPFLGPIGAVRIGRVDGEFAINPSPEQLEAADMELIVAGTRGSIVMVEGGADQLPESDMIGALRHAHGEILKIIDSIEDLQKRAGKEKIVPPVAEDLSELEAELRGKAEQPLSEAFQIREKKARASAVKTIEKGIIDEYVTEFANQKVEIDTLAGWDDRRNGLAKMRSNVKNILHDLGGELMRNRVLDTGERIDGRKNNEIRPIACEVRAVARPHGASLFTRGETQAMVNATLGSGFDEQTIDGMIGRYKKTFMLHYNFPPFSVGEARPLRGPGRREVGHGTLAERAIKPVLPSHEDFPYTIRVVSETLESNGSSSMAAVCGSTLALLDSGVPLKAPVAGIAMGLITDGERTVILSDILGDEDHLGDMDFKVAGTEEGITALQMDIKVKQIDWEIVEAALAQAREGRLHILDCMRKETDSELHGLKAREELHEFAPRLEVLFIKPDRIRDIIGPGGKVIRAIQETTGAKIDVEDSGRVSVFGPDRSAVDQAMAMVDELTQEAEIGKIYLAKVKRVADFGAFAEIFPGTDGLIHISHLAEGRVENVTDVLNEGDEVLAKCIDIDPAGRIRLSRKEALAEIANQADAE
ncbi:MAG: polyribonucleotide nucleotidyltransferase [Deltaproteobacteria bacterium]|jgi:polyribonucleotide nucleotidyltransferase|nr:polyribonucleotide nucleotidyltransferase [Deltaproteobacteria bacterium]MBW2382167.1 polyribonucleotide nucleotidyltransferase [Deltaproteobacteria bacterium]MBW2696302.1 polyribonucleotide nucleotidyltransferase [Deltaproteobacteria bacterium]